MTQAENQKAEAIELHLQQKRASMAKTMQQMTMQRIGPGSYLKEGNLNMIGKHKSSNSVKGFGNGFISKADRGLIASTGNKAPSSSMTHLRSMSVPR